jgi:hypothetical protein
MEAHAQLLMVFLEPWPVFPERREWQSAALRQMPGLSGHIWFPCRQNVVPVTVHVFGARNARKRGLSWDEPPYRFERTERIVLFDAVVPYDLDAIDIEMRQQGQTIDPAYIARLDAADDLRKLAGDIILAASIASPGALDPVEVVYSVDGQVRNTAFPRLGGGEARKEAKKKGWPPLAELSVATCLQWLYRIPGFVEGVPSGPLGRAITALSQISPLGEPESSAALMWCMVGLEALYTRGKEGIASQLLEKAQVLLGPVGRDRKAFRGLYDYRSRFVHGGLDFPLSYTPYDGLDAFLDAQLNLYDNELLAEALLLATLQAMVTRDLMDLHFRWELVEPDVGDQAARPLAPGPGEPA